MISAHFACALSTASSGKEALSDALGQLERRLSGRTPDLVLAFATHHYGAQLETIGPEISRALAPSAVAGCTAESVLGDGQEIEGRPGLVLWAACLPETKITTFQAKSCAQPAAGKFEFPGLPKLDARNGATLLALADPYSFPVEHFLEHQQELTPGLPILGGLTSGAIGPGQTLFFTPDGVEEIGLQGIVLEGKSVPRPVVSQGCRPVGKPYVITECERNEIKRLGGRPALEVYMEAVTALDTADQRLFQSGQFVGLAVDPTRSTFERGDLLVHGVMGVNPSTRSFSVSAFVRRGQTIQLQVRDSQTAGADLTKLVHESHGSRAAGAALIFTCNGRGRRMFESADHDVSHVLQGCEEPIPTAGFFAAGEIGPIGGRNFLHGFTASVAMFPG